MSNLVSIYRTICTVGYGREALVVEAQDLDCKKTQLTLRHENQGWQNGNVLVTYLDDGNCETEVEDVFEVKLKLDKEGLESLVELLQAMTAKQETNQLTAKEQTCQN
tara:strand:- start:1135 stop:1455 length:321 start_codon:yes stop_codon:yes gene_type:complete